MASDPEIMHTADIPEAESEVQEALIARLQAPKKKIGRPRKKEQESKKDPKTTGLAPLLVQSPRSGVLRDERGRVMKGSVSPAKGSKWREVQKYAEVHAFEAIDFWVAVMRDPLTKTSDRLTASQWLVERGLGKAIELAKIELENKTTSESTENNVLVLANGQKVSF